MNEVESPEVYIPLDRRRALARGEELPGRSYGAALFADISGFTKLTEALANELGPQRGAEELTRHLNGVYDALIGELHTYGGSVIGFSGDAITCWLDGDDGLRATACALAMQGAMGRLPPAATPGGSTITLAMKVSVAAGVARRLVVGDPLIQVIDALGGAVVDTLAAAEQLARPGEVIVDGVVASALGGRAVLGERRLEPGSARRFTVVDGLRKGAGPALLDPEPPPALGAARVRPWLLPAVYERVRGGGHFLAELRPCVAMFVGFGGIDHDADDGGPVLDSFIRDAQHVLTRYGGNLLSLTIGDKGAYVYGAFGAPQAHEDDAARAVAAAAELLETADPARGVRIGLAQGRMRTGAYGSSARRTYGVLGDSTNLSARLMQAAGAGEAVAAASVRRGDDGFAWERLPDLVVKGKADPVSAFRLAGGRRGRGIRIEHARYATSLIGRTHELALLEERLERAVGGEGQLVGVVAEAGMGKSRLAAAAVAAAAARGVPAYAGECQAYGANTSYLVWRGVWTGLFGLEAVAAEERAAALGARLEAIDPALVPRLPLLGPLLGLPLPDNELTRSFDAKLRKESLESLLAACLHAQVGRPILVLLEDCHWIDELSDDLLEVLARELATLPVLLVLTARPAGAGRLRPLRPAPLPHYTELPLTELAPAETERLILERLDAAGEPPRALVERLAALSQGNPFYVEELVNYLLERTPDLTGASASSLELPTNLHGLVLGRLDGLPEKPRIAGKVASVIGRSFDVPALRSAARGFPGARSVPASLGELAAHDFVTLESAPDERYAFRHAVTQEVVYESIPYAQRAALHVRVARRLEQGPAAALEARIDLLAHHYGLGDDEPKKRTYLLRAADLAQRRYANEAALDYYRRALPLLDGAARTSVLLKLGKVLDLTGAWDEAEERVGEARSLAAAAGDEAAVAWADTAAAELVRKRGDYDEAAAGFRRARESFERLGDLGGVGQARHLAGTLAAQRGDYETARGEYEASLAIREQLGDRASMGSLLSNLGIIAEYARDYLRARSLHEEALALRRSVGDRGAIAVSLNNLGNVALLEGDTDEAQSRLEEAVRLQREVGDRWMLANALNNLGNVVRARGDLARAESLYDESLAAYGRLGDRWALAYVLEDIGVLAALRGEAERALRLVAAARTLRDEIGAPRPPADQEELERMLAPTRRALSREAQERAWTEGLALSLEGAIAEGLRRRPPPPASPDRPPP